MLRCINRADKKVREKNIDLDYSKTSTVFAGFRGTWSDVYKSLMHSDASSILPLDRDMISKIKMCLETEPVIPMSSLLKHLEVKRSEEKAVVGVLLSRLPLLVLNTPKKGKWVFSMDVQDALLSVALLLASDTDMEALMNSEFENICQNFYEVQEISKNIDEIDEYFPECIVKKESERRGRHGYVTYCDQVVPCLRELLLTRFGAAARKRNSMVQLSQGEGFRLTEIRSKVAARFPSLNIDKAHRTTIRRYLSPPNKGRNASKSYKSYVPLKI